MNRRRVIVGAFLAVIATVSGAATLMILRGWSDGSGAGAEERAPRIVALSPAIAVALRDLGAGEYIVGRHGWDAWSDQSIPAIGDQAGIDYESLIRVDPTLILMQWGAQSPPDRLLRLAEEHRWRVINLDVLTLADIEGMIGTLRDALAPAAPEVTGRSAEVLSALRRAWSARHAINPDNVGRVLLLHGVDPPSALGPGSCHHQLLGALGGRPAITAGSAYISMDAEDVLRLAPDAVVIFAPAPPGGPRRRLATASRGELSSVLGGDGAGGGLASLDIPALRNGRIAVIDHPLCLIPSTCMGEVADELAAVLEAWSAAEPAGPRRDD